MTHYETIPLFDRNPIIFNSILDFYRTGKLHFNDDICPKITSVELEFWMISVGNISHSCQKNFVREKSKTLKESYVDKIVHMFVNT
jgi:hypothetical protein